MKDEQWFRINRQCFLLRNGRHSSTVGGVTLKETSEESSKLFITEYKNFDVTKNASSLIGCKTESFYGP